MSTIVSHPTQAMSSSETEAPGGQGKPPREKRGVPSGLWMSCGECGEMLFRKAVEQNFNVCPKCDSHMYLSAQSRIASVLDEGTFEEWDRDLTSVDPLGLPAPAPGPRPEPGSPADAPIEEQALHR